ncbi:MAG: InlB B-repeat-containing protein, partial [Lachnospiraceae bacterium]|nr:InlB B-repeat-containing protein [Lachnospiraceae bacterium]
MESIRKSSFKRIGAVLLVLFMIMTQLAPVTEAVGKSTSAKAQDKEVQTNHDLPVYYGDGEIVSGIVFKAGDKILLSKALSIYTADGTNSIVPANTEVDVIMNPGSNSSNYPLAVSYDDQIIVMGSNYAKEESGSARPLDTMLAYTVTEDDTTVTISDIRRNYAYVESTPITIAPSAANNAPKRGDIFCATNPYTSMGSGNASVIGPDGNKYSVRKLDKNANFIDSNGNIVINSEGNNAWLVTDVSVVTVGGRLNTYTFTVEPCNYTEYFNVIADAGILVEGAVDGKVQLAKSVTFKSRYPYMVENRTRMTLINMVKDGDYYVCTIQGVNRDLYAERRSVIYTSEELANAKTGDVFIPREQFVYDTQITPHLNQFIMFGTLMTSKSNSTNTRYNSSSLGVGTSGTRTIFTDLTIEDENYKYRPMVNQETEGNSWFIMNITSNDIEFCGFSYDDFAMTYTHQNAVAPTCTEDGIMEHWVDLDGFCFADEEGTQYLESVVVPATDHAWGVPVYEWQATANGYTCKATRTCQNDETHVETETVNAGTTIRLDPTCESDGVQGYAAFFDNPAFVTQTKSDILEATGHAYEITGWNWEETANGYTAQAVCECENCHDIKNYDAEVSKVNALQNINYTATVTIDNVDYSALKSVEAEYGFEVENGYIIQGAKDVYSYADAVTVKADAVKDGQTFAGWYLDGTLVSTNTTYTFYVKRDMTVAARYEDTPVEEQAVAAVVITRTNIESNKQRVVFSLTWSLPKGCRLLESGIVRAYDSGENLDLEHVDNTNIKNHVATNKTANGNCNFNLNVSATTKLRTIYATAYVKYLDK